MKKIRPKILAGPNPSSGAARCWNIASVSEEEGEIVLYGDVVSQQPVDWWTGEPEPGLFITPEGFMQDLEAVKGKSRITVKLNSCGGDLYTGIAIHNAIKALGAHVDVVVEGIAASAASVIMCAGDTVQVYPGSLVMIHEPACTVIDYCTIDDLKQIIKMLNAGIDAAAEVYTAKTGTEIDKLEAMTCVCSVGLDMIAIPGDTPVETIAGIIADEMAIGVINNKTTAVRVIPAIGKGVGDCVEYGGLFGRAPIMPVNPNAGTVLAHRGGRFPAPLNSLKN